TFTGANTYTGGTSVNIGTLSISDDANLGALPASVAPGNITLNAGTLLANSDVTLHPNRGIALAGSGTLDAAPGKTLTYGGVVANAGASASVLTKGSNGGTVFLTGDNTPSGGTTVNGGTLAIL